MYGTLKHQTIAQAGTAEATLSWRISLQNDAKVADRITVKGAASQGGFAVTYLDEDGNDVTSDVVSGTFKTPRLASGADYRLDVVVGVTADTAPGDEFRGKIHGHSHVTPKKGDVVEFVARRN